jgi:proteasome assembly chaperone (PAC2) family protein
MSEHFVRHASPTLHEPILVVSLEGWIDAAGSAQGAMRHLIQATDAQALVTFDADTFLDWRARRPTMHLREGVNTGLTFATLEMSYARASRDVVFLHGHEPDMRWNLFCDLVVGVVEDLGITAMYALGSYPFATPHTRPPVVSLSASSVEVASKYSFDRNSVDVPAGAAGMLEWRIGLSGREVLGLWAQVPHYAASMAYPAASLALVDALSGVSGLEVETLKLTADADARSVALNELVSNSAEHQALVGQLEQIYDATVAKPPASRDDSTLLHPGQTMPTGDELAQELERFLRDQ